MGFGFVHSADWQIGKPIRVIGDERIVGRLEGARLAIVDRLAAVAREQRVRHVLVAGDIYDSNRPTPKILRQPLERMKRHQDIVWVLLPGNHDPVEGGGVWERVLNENIPENIKVLLKPELVELTEGVFVLPSPFGCVGGDVDPTSWMDDVRTPDTVFRIGLAHGSVKGFGSDSDPDHMIDPKRAQKAKLDYLALGDWHGTVKINVRTWYSGTPEPDRFADNEAGCALVVRLEAPGAMPEVQKIATGQYVWAKVDLAFESEADIAQVDRAVAELSDDPARVLLRLKVSGDVTPRDLKIIEDWQERVVSQLQYLSVDDRDLFVGGEADESPEICKSSALQDVFGRLQTLATSGDEPHAVLAKDALRRLVRYAAAGGRGDA